MESTGLNETIGRVGPIFVEIIGNGELYDKFCDEIEITEDKDASIDLSIVIDNELFKKELSEYQPIYSSAKQHMTFNENTYYYDIPVPYICENLFDQGTCKLTLQESPSTDIKLQLKKILTTQPNSNSQLSYSLFWIIIQIRLLLKNSSFIHAGSMYSEDETIAFIGTGGSGKTSTMFHFLDNYSYKYLSEDFGIIDQNGNIYRSPKTLSIYDSDIANGTRILEKIYDNFSVKEKIRWRILKSVFRKNPMMKIPVNSVFSEELISTPMRLDKLFYIQRINARTPSLKPVGSNVLAERITNVTLREMKVLVELLNMIGANSEGGQFWSLNKLIDRIKSVYLRSFDKIDLFILEVPFLSNGSDVEQMLKDEKLIKV